MRNKIKSCLKWIKSRKTAILSCFAIIALTLSIALPMASKNPLTAKADSGTAVKAVVNNEQAFLIQSYFPVVLSYPTSSGTSHYLILSSTFSFFVRGGGLGVCSGNEYTFLKDKTELNNVNGYKDVSMSMLLGASQGYSYSYDIETVRIYGYYSLGNNLSWDDFFTRCLANEFTVSVQYVNYVHQSSTLVDTRPFNTYNFAQYDFYFTHFDNNKYNSLVRVYISSMNKVPSTQQTIAFSNYTRSGYTLLTYVNFTTSVVNLIADNQYMEGYKVGKNVGLSEGETIGYNKGKTAGLSEGETIGYNKGINEKLSNLTPWETIVDGVNTFLNIQVLPNVKLSVILSVGFGVILLGFAVKIFLGG